MNNKSSTITGEHFYDVEVLDPSSRAYTKYLLGFEKVFMDSNLSTFLSGRSLN